jgi:hypothetical protein
VNYIVLEKGVSEGCIGFQIRDVASFGNLKMDLVISENSSKMMVIFEVYPILFGDETGMLRSFDIHCVYA